MKICFKDISKLSFFYVTVFTILMVIDMPALSSGFYKNKNSRGDNGYSVEYQDNSKVIINYSITTFSLNDTLIGETFMQFPETAGLEAPDFWGAPTLPYSWTYINVPQGSEVSFNILSYRSETINDVLIPPVQNLLSDNASRSDELYFNQSIYQANRFYPEEPILLSDIDLLGGLDVVILKLTPFHFNPVTRQLIVYRDIKIEINFEGGNGYAAENIAGGEVTEQMMSDLILNYKSVQNLIQGGVNENGQKKAPAIKRKKKENQV